MASMFDRFSEAAKSAAKGAADTLFAPKGGATTPTVIVQTQQPSAGIFTPTDSGSSRLPAWLLPAAAVGALLLLSRR